MYLRPTTCHSNGFHLLLFPSPLQQFSSPSASRPVPSVFSRPFRVLLLCLENRYIHSYYLRQAAACSKKGRFQKRGLVISSLGKKFRRQAKILVSNMAANLGDMAYKIRFCCCCCCCCTPSKTATLRDRKDVFKLNNTAVRDQFRNYGGAQQRS